MTGSDEQLKILLLCDDSPSHANTVLDHINAFPNYSKHHVTLVNPMQIKYRFGLNFDNFDVLIIHYSLCIIYEYYLPKPVEEEIKAFAGLTVQFIQDEYRWVNTIVDKMIELNIDLLYTCVPDSEIPKIYGRLVERGVTILTTLTGYVPEELTQYPSPPTAERKLDVCYRGRDIPFWLGSLTREKFEIGRRFKEEAETTDLLCDIGWKEEDRIYGKNWNKFVCSAKATLGTESGASIADFDGEVEAKVKDYLARHPGAEFSEVAANVLQPYEGNVVVNVVSPRIFEAIALRTALILFPGSYSGVVQADRHFIALEKDFSNFDYVCSCLKDDELLQEMVNRAYTDIIESGKYSFQTFINLFDQQTAYEYGRRFPTNQKQNVNRSWKRRCLLKCGKLFGTNWVRVGNRLWRFNLGLHQVAYFIGSVFYATKLTSLSFALVLRKKALRRLFLSALKHSSIDSIQEILRLLVQAARVSSAHAAWVETTKGKEPITILPEIRGNLCVLKIALCSETLPRQVRIDDLIDGFQSGCVNEIVWEKSKKINRFPIMLEPDYPCFPVLSCFANRFPKEVAMLIYDN